RLTASPATAASASASTVAVYDGVLDAATCRRLNRLAVESTDRSPDGSFLFRRGGGDGDKVTRMTPLESAIDTLLTSLGDRSELVEYWSRETYINMDAHADIDENFLKDEGVLRCPLHGHVLYLRVPHVPGDRVGPTVVFPDRQVAWGSVSPRAAPVPATGRASYRSEANSEERSREYVVDVENYWDAEMRRQNGVSDHDGASEMEEMVVVPAREGRLLRFVGSAFHAVPRPPDRYLLNREELAAFLKEDCDEDEGEDEDNDWAHAFWDDNDDDGIEDMKNSNKRSVLLFNTWPEASLGPRGVLTDRAAPEVPDGIVIEGEDADGDRSFVEEEQQRRWQDEYGDDFERVQPNPLGEWTTIPLEEPSRTSPRKEVVVPLMGNPSRRGCPEDRAVMMGRVTGNIFHEDRRVFSVTLEEGMDVH
ncbi:hypothetical protein ACHAWF_002795, partial [Thalassiosira exigua]